MLDYKLKIDKPDKKAKKKKLFSFTWRRLRKSKSEGSHSQTELGFARHESNKPGGGAKREGPTNLIKMTFKMNFHVWSSNGVLDSAEISDFVQYLKPQYQFNS